MRLYPTLWQTYKLKLKTRRTKKTGESRQLSWVNSINPNQVDTWHVFRNKKPNVSKDVHKTAASITNFNRYEILSDSDVEPTVEPTEGHRPPHVRTTTSHKNPGNKESTFDKSLITNSPP